MTDTVFMTKDHGYKTSRCYEILYELMKKRSVVCFVRDDEKSDVASTIYHQSGLHVISARGVCYVHAKSKELFIRGCSKNNVEFIFPCTQEDKP